MPKRQAVETNLSLYPIIPESFGAITPKPNPTDGKPPKRRKRKSRRRIPPELLNFCAVLGISLLVLGVALYVILSTRFGEDIKKWAFGVTGLILGYWLRVRA